MTQQLLKNQGMITRVPGDGTYVAQPNLERHAGQLVPFIRGMRRRGYTLGTENITFDLGGSTHRVWQGSISWKPLWLRYRDGPARVTGGRPWPEIRPRRDRSPCELSVSARMTGGGIS